MQSKAQLTSWAGTGRRRTRSWQPPPTDIEISNQRAAELTAARAEIARLQAENARLPALSRNIIGRNVYQDLRDVYSTLNDFDLSADEARRRVLLYLHGMSTQYGWGWAAPPQPLQGMTQAEAFAAPGAIGALWVGPPTPDGVPTEQEQNARLWLPRFAPQQPQPFTSEGHRLE